MLEEKKPFHVTRFSFLSPLKFKPSSTLFCWYHEGRARRTPEYWVNIPSSPGDYDDSRNYFSINWNNNEILSTAKSWGQNSSIMFRKGVRADAELVFSSRLNVFLWKSCKKKKRTNPSSFILLLLPRSIIFNLHKHPQMISNSKAIVLILWLLLVARFFVSKIS